MCALILLGAPEGGGQVAEIARTFGVDWPHLIAQTISFSIVCALLYWLAYKPILRMLDQRRTQIAQGLENAAKIQAELAKTEAARQEVLAAAHAEAQTIVDEARATAIRVRDDESRKAAAAALEIIARAHQAASDERARLLADARHELGRLVVETTAAVTGKILSADDHRRLAEETARLLTGES